MRVRLPGAAGLLCVTIVSGVVEVQGKRADQPAIDVTAMAAEAGRWRSLLADGRRRMPGRERAIVLDAGGRILGTAEGSSRDVMLPTDLVARLLDPLARLILVHNHTQGTGLSQADLRILGFPGIRAVVAVGHDASLYIASAGGAFDRGSEDQMYRLARDRLVEALERRIGRETVDGHLDHLVSLTLARSDWLEYHATLGGRRRESFEARRDVFELAVNRTAHELRARLAGDR
jgi:hypothetical protein